MAFNSDFASVIDVKAQKDHYNGIEFRSKLESKTAQALDIIGIRYEYEPKGYKLSNGMWYRPDFFLPDAHQFIECKGVMTNIDSAKIIGLVSDTNIPVLALSYDNAMLFMRRWDSSIGEIMSYKSWNITLSKCSECNTRWFMSWADTYECPNCGTNKGTHHLTRADGIRSATELFRYSQEIAADKPIYQEIANDFNN